MTWGYIPSANPFEDLLRKVTGLPNPGGRLRASIVKKYINSRKRAVLDCGCGSGVYTIELVKLGFLAVGVDTESLSVCEAKKNSKKMKLCIPFIVCDIRFLPFKDNSFNQVLCVDVLEHILEFNSAVKEMGRILQKGGNLILTTTVNEKRVLPVSLEAQNQELGHVHKYIALEILKTKLHQERFEIMRIHYFYKFFSLIAMELLYRLMGSERVKLARQKVYSYNPIAIFIFCVVYPIMLLDKLLASGVVGREALILACKVCAKTSVFE